MGRPVASCQCSMMLCGAGADLGGQPQLLGQQCLVAPERIEPARGVHRQAEALDAAQIGIDLARHRQAVEAVEGAALAHQAKLLLDRRLGQRDRPLQRGGLRAAAVAADGRKRRAHAALTKDCAACGSAPRPAAALRRRGRCPRASRPCRPSRRCGRRRCRASTGCPAAGTPPARRASRTAGP